MTLARKVFLCPSCLNSKEVSQIRPTLCGKLPLFLPFLLPTSLPPSLSSFLPAFLPSFLSQTLPCFQSFVPFPLGDHFEKDFFQNLLLKRRCDFTFFMILPYINYASRLFTFFSVVHSVVVTGCLCAPLSQLGNLPCSYRSHLAFLTTSSEWPGQAMGSLHGYVVFLFLPSHTFLWYNSLQIFLGLFYRPLALEYSFLFYR